MLKNIMIFRKIFGVLSGRNEKINELEEYLKSDIFNPNNIKDVKEEKPIVDIPQKSQ